MDNGLRLGLEARIRRTIRRPSRDRCVIIGLCSYKYMYPKASTVSRYAYVQALAIMTEHDSGLSGMYR